MQMAIITSYVPGAAYGLLGPQIAATIIQDHTRHPCIVIAVTRDDDKDFLKKALSDYFGPRRPVIGFSALSGREDLFPWPKSSRTKERSPSWPVPRRMRIFEEKKDPR
jgi:hypothetical protein